MMKMKLLAVVTPPPIYRIERVGVGIPDWVMLDILQFDQCSFFLWVLFLLLYGWTMVA